MAEIVVFVATPGEGALLEDALAEAGGRLCVTGIGPVNAAFAAARALGDGGADRTALICGVGGAYPGAGLAVGDVVCAETELYADLGAETADGFLAAHELGIPGTEDDPSFAALPLDLFPAAQRVPFVTSATCSGTRARAIALAERTGGRVESMEGAAIVQVARALGVPVGQVRGISNEAGDRDKSRWRIEDAARTAQEAVRAWLRG